MIAYIEFEYATQDKIKKDLSDEAYEELRHELPQLKLTEKRDEAWLYDKYVIDLARDGELLTKHDLSFVVKRFKGAYKVAGRVEGTTYNLQVAIPAIGLLSMNEVTHLDDACTDELQRHLDDGWRIIAVCPPDAQRRPDYILGRSKHNAN